MQKSYGWILLSYAFVIFYFLIVGDRIVTSVFVIALAIYHLVELYQEREKQHTDIENKMTMMQHKLSQTEKLKEETYHQFISLSTTLGSGVLLVNAEGKIDFANKDITHYFNIEVTDKDYQILTNVKPLYKFVNEAFLLEEPRREQIHFQEHFYDLISTPIFENKIFQGCIIIVHDISLIKTAERFQKQFTADVSHELKTPLSTIKGFTEILSRGDKVSNADKEEFIEIIQKEVSRMETIITDLLIISKMDRVDYELEYKKNDIKAMIEDAVGLLKHDIEQKNLVLIQNIEIKSFMFDYAKMHHVMLNLIRNAINYTDEGHIEIKGYVEKGQYVIEVVDTGIGISKDEMDMIFKRFYRVDSARSRDTGGSGLGLSIIKNVVRKHDGTIEVDSEVGVGTTFKILLPMKK
jgi:two-component system phosphate regulon sensor histidine kinase PhoR